MMNKFHKSITQDKWNQYPKRNQILMIASEIGRAKSWIVKSDFNKAKDCYLRAIELLDMTVGDLKWRNGWKELLRFKELLGEAYSFKFTDLSLCLSLYKTLLSWDRDTAKLAVL